ncbi:hypothetical protein BD414DRAFT_420032, partial [Trametes punicea]
GPPIMHGTDHPISFMVRGEMVRRASPNSMDDASERRAIVPRELPPPRYKTPPRRKYRAKPIEHDPSHIHMSDGKQLVLVNDMWWPFPKDSEQRYRSPAPKKALAQPIPGLTKPARGRHVPRAEDCTDPRRRYICPVETCKKAFTKRNHVHRHIKSIHCHDKCEFPIHGCNMPFCYHSSDRRDNHEEHVHKYGHYEEIFACTPENGFKGTHLLDPQVSHPFSADGKPYQAIPNSSLPAFNLWLFHERARRRGVDIPPYENSDVNGYFRAHPEEVEAALRGDPEWEWLMPPPGPEFTPIDHRCMTGTFKLDIKRGIRGDGA